MIIKELKKVEDLDAGIKLWNKNYTKYSLERDLYRQNLLAPYSGLQIRLFGGFENNRLIAFAAIKQPVEELTNYVGPERGWISLLVAESGAGSTDWKELLAYVTKELEKFWS